MTVIEAQTQNKEISSWAMNYTTKGGYGGLSESIFFRWRRAIPI